MAITGMKLRTAVPGGNWASFIVAAPVGGAVEGVMAKTEDTVGMWMQTEDAGEDVAFIYRAEKILLPKKAVSGGAFAVGDKIWYDTVNFNVANANAGAYLWIGICIEAATALATTVKCDFNGAKAT